MDIQSTLSTSMWLMPKVDLSCPQRLRRGESFPCSHQFSREPAGSSKDYDVLWCVDVGNARRIRPTPGTVVGGKSPKLACLGTSSTGMRTGAVVSFANSLGNCLNLR